MSGLDAGLAAELKARNEQLWLVLVGAALASGPEGRARLFAAIDPRDCRIERLAGLLAAIKGGEKLGGPTWAALGVEVAEGETPMQAVLRCVRTAVLEHKVNVFRTKLADRSLPPSEFLRRTREHLEAIEKEFAQ